MTNRSLPTGRESANRSEVEPLHMRRHTSVTQRLSSLTSRLFSTSSTERNANSGGNVGIDGRHKNSFRRWFSHHTSRPLSPTQHGDADRSYSEAVTRRVSHNGVISITNVDVDGVRFNNDETSADVGHGWPQSARRLLRAVSVRVTRAKHSKRTDDNASDNPRKDPKTHNCENMPRITANGRPEFPRLATVSKPPLASTEDLREDERKESQLIVRPAAVDSTIGSGTLRATTFTPSLPQTSSLTSTISHVTARSDDQTMSVTTNQDGPQSSTMRCSPITDVRQSSIVSPDDAPDTNHLTPDADDGSWPNALVIGESETVSNATPQSQKTSSIKQPYEMERKESRCDTMEDANGTETPSEMTESERARFKRSFVLAELVETERDYVRDLGLIVDGYVVEINQRELADDIQGKEKIVFANISQIHEFHKNTFQKELEKCLVDYEAAAKAFVNFERRLHVYVVYCQNKPKSEYLMQQEPMESLFNDIRSKLGHRLSLSDLLIKPVQRIMKYQLLLKDILKYTQRAGDPVEWYEKAMRVMCVVPKACDDMMQVGRLQGFSGNITTQGKLICQKTLLVSDNPPGLPFKPNSRHLFLFEQSVIIADSMQPKKEFCNPNYVFKAHIMVNKMTLEPDVRDDEQSTRFVLKSNGGGSGGGVVASFVLQAATASEKRQLISCIRRLLDAQADFLRALQQPIEHQRDATNGEAPTCR